MGDAPKPDFSKGFPFADLAEGKPVSGEVNGEEAIVVRRGEEVFAIGAHCTHYHGPLAEGLVLGETVRCPWHHACFSLRSGEALRAPALDPVPSWKVRREGSLVFVGEKLAAPPKASSQNAPRTVVIVGGGAAGLAAADMLRRTGYSGKLTMLSADDSAPYDRPNLSKDFLAGTAQEDWIPLRPQEFYKEHGIELLLNARATSLDARNKQVVLENGKTCPFDRLLLATGAEPIHLEIEGVNEGRILYLRTFRDSKAVVTKAQSAKRVVIVGASFIGLETAASLRSRGLEVHVVAPGREPLGRVMGTEVGRFVRSVHESHGVLFHLGKTVARVDKSEVVLSDGKKLEADFVVVGAGVRPSTELAERAGLAVDRGVTVNEFLETNVPGIFAAGDIARWPDPHSGERIRIEHWVVAERQGQVAARNMLGQKEQFRAVPFFWSQHYDVTINYIGHAEKWDAVELDGSLDKRDCSVSYQRGGRRLATATIGRDFENLQIEAELEKTGRR